MVFPTNERFPLLVYLHYLGLISLPEFYNVRWKNRAHKYYSNSVLSLLVLVTTLIGINACVFAVKDVSQFLQRTFEALTFTLFTMGAILLNWKLNDELSLLHMMDKLFSCIDRKTYAKYRNKESVRMKIYAAFISTVACSAIIDSIFPTKETIALMAKLYHRTDPVKLFPVTIWIPFLDTNKMVYFIIVYCIELYVIVLIVACSYHLVKVGMTFSIAVTGQVEMLSKYVKLVGREHRDQAGRRIYFMDVVDGGCLLVINKSGHQSATSTSTNASLKAQPVQTIESNDALYEAYFMRLILMRHQQLLVFINKYKRFFVFVLNGTTLAFIGMEMISVYQIIYMKHLTLLTQMKMVPELGIILYVLFNWMEESERLHNCNLMIGHALYQSEWYKVSSVDTRRSLMLMLRQTQRDNYLVTMSGYSIYNYALYVKTLKMSYSFANFCLLYSLN